MKRALTQQAFLRQAMTDLHMTRNQLAERIGAKRRALDNWLLPSASKGFRVMPDHLWRFIGEIMESGTHATKRA